MESSNRHQLPRHLRYLPEIAILLVTAWVVYRSVAHLYLSPDSSHYLNAAENLVANGRLVISSNYVSHTMSPSFDPYTEWPPGFPFFLAPFVMVGQDPFASAAVAQAVAIVLYNIGIYVFARRISLHPVLIVTAVAILNLSEPFAMVLNALWTETLFIALSLLAGAGMLRLSNPPGREGTRSRALLALFLASSVRFAGVANACWFAAIPLRTWRADSDSPANAEPRQSLASLGGLAVAATIAPSLLWFIRNWLMYGAPILLLPPLVAPHVDSMIVPFKYVTTLASTWGRFSAPIVLVGVIALISYPLARERGPRKGIQTILILAMTSHFLVVWLPSLVAPVVALGPRLLAPALAIGTIAALHGVHCVSANVPSTRLRYAIILIPIALLAADKGVQARLAQPIVVGLSYPPERALWQQIHELSPFEQASHFYSDADYVHQVFANLPQRIIFDYRIWEDPFVLIGLTREGNRPFFVVREDGDEDTKLEQYVQLGFPLRRIRPPPGGFAVYYSP